MERLPSRTNRIFEPHTAKVPEAVLRALLVMGTELKQCEPAWLVGGSCGALLQGVELQAVPRDLDVYVDAEHAGEIHRALQAYSTDEQIYSETGMYGSLLSHYSIEGVQVELVGSLKVRLDAAEYEVRVQSLLASYAYEGLIGGATIRFMPLVHELLFNVLRDRPDRFEPLAEAMRGEPDRHIPLLNELLQDNRIGPLYVDRLKELFRIPSGRKGEPDEP
ncbi:hypothetical protein FE783_05830 [Paenibacillus mesophilus]|uniref:hypothetical protein n=1 Tax=Paenibacillus mesophilus TaxID=2582849 RepID=UPI00110D9DA4|nr:hypothetical protein [Paenibacillus mesophilus]TMV51301.1 hypothetical protein FE783_05830 [Paenibacillus mesophilus]